MYKINIFDNGGITCDRYTVFINKNIYYMSLYPDRVNEVCSYGGEFKTGIKDMVRYIRTLDNVKLNKIPKTLKYQIRYLIREMRRTEGF